MASLGSSAQNDELKISLLTCTPGQEIYSLFGHTAIRIQGTVAGQFMDNVYNYGTFEWTDDFPIKFARGKLLYILSRSPFHAFNHTYILENRGIQEQILDLNPEQAMAILERLEENYLPENREYLYDFFYDNCATRVIDIFQDALGPGLVFTAPTPDSTFRDMIHPYLEDWYWTNLGIDLGLGLPCDKKLEALDDCFLPDYLFDELAQAELDEKPLVGSIEILLESEPEEMQTYNQPLLVFASILLLYLILIAFGTRIPRVVRVADTLFLFFSGIAGLFIALLWFATDHTATANNLNLLWAMPLNLVFPFLKKGPTRKKYFTFYMILLALVLLGWKFGPQAFNNNIAPFVAVLLLASWRMVRR
jgi:hypothetical protein